MCRSRQRADDESLDHLTDSRPDRTLRLHGISGEIELQRLLGDHHAADAQLPGAEVSDEDVLAIHLERVCALDDAVIGELVLERPEVVSRWLNHCSSFLIPISKPWGRTLRMTGVPGLWRKYPAAVPSANPASTSVCHSPRVFK